MAASKGGKAKKEARRASKAAPKPGARAGKGGAGTNNKGAAVAGGAAKPDAARVRAWRLDGRQGVFLHKSRKWWEVRIHYGELLYLGCFKTEEEAIACRLLGEDRIAAGCHPETGKYVPEAERPKPPRPYNNTHLLGAPAATFSDAALGEHATDLAAKVDARTLDIDQVVGVGLDNKSGKWRAKMKDKKKTRQLGSQTSDLAEAIRRRLLGEKAKALFPDKNPQDYVAARTGPAAGAGKKRKRADADRAEGAAGGAAAATASPRPRAPPPAVPSPSLAEKLAAAQEMLATERVAAAELRAVMAAREREAEAHRVEAERLRAHLASLQREAAALRAVGGDDDQCARSRPYYCWR